MCVTGFLVAQGDGVGLAVTEWLPAACSTTADWLVAVIAPLVAWPAGCVSPVVGAEELSLTDGDGETVPLDESLGVGVGLGLTIWPIGGVEVDDDAELAGLARLQIADLVLPRDGPTPRADGL